MLPTNRQSSKPSSAILLSGASRPPWSTDTASRTSVKCTRDRAARTAYCSSERLSWHRSRRRQMKSQTATITPRSLWTVVSRGIVSTTTQHLLGYVYLFTEPRWISVAGGRYKAVRYCGQQFSRVHRGRGRTVSRLRDFRCNGARDRAYPLLDSNQSQQRHLFDVRIRPGTVWRPILF